MEKGRVEFNDPNFRPHPIVGLPGVPPSPLGGPTTTALHAAERALIAAALAWHEHVVSRKWRPTQAEDDLATAADAYRRAGGQT